MATPVQWVCAILAAVPCVALPVRAAPMILNEYSAVADNRYLDGSDYDDALNPIQEDAYFATVPGLPDGRIEGNGGDWLELVVIVDHLNIQGWQLRWAETGVGDTTGADLWYGDADVEQGIIMFSSTAAIWSDLRKGTIITIGERGAVEVDTDWFGSDRNLTDGLSPGEVDMTIDLQTDLSYRPVFEAPDEDWWLHVSTRHEQAAPFDNRLVQTFSNVSGQAPGDFSVGDDDWQLAIVDDLGADIFGPIGEDISGGFSLSNREAACLQVDPSGSVGSADFDDVTLTTFGQPNQLDAWGLEYQSFRDLRIPEPMTMLLLAAGLPAALKRGRRRC